jgi:hypothetical protein
VEVIEALIHNGANPNAKNSQSHFLTPLTLVLLRGASTTAIGAAMIAQANQQQQPGGGEINGWGNAWPNVAFSSSSAAAADPDHHPQHLDSPGSTKRGPVNHHHHHHHQNHQTDNDKTRLTGRKVWIKAAEVLIKSGAHWDASWRSPNHCSQLHLLLAAFPPCREESHLYRGLLKSALEDGLNPTAEDDHGRNALFVLSEAMASVAADQSPDSTRLVHYLLEYSSNLNPFYGIGGSDRTGRTIFDIEEVVAHSCLAACRAVLKQASAKSQEVNHLSSTGQHHGALRPQNTLRSGSASTAASRAASLDWDDPVSNSSNRVPTSILASNSTGSIIRHNNNNNNNNVARSRSGDLYTSHVGIATNPATATTASAASVNSRGSRIGHYFEDEEGEEDFGAMRNNNSATGAASGRLSTRKPSADLSTMASMYSPIVSLRQRK